MKIKDQNEILTLAWRLDIRRCHENDEKEFSLVLGCGVGS